MEFIISDFSEKKEANEVWYSSPFYTHNRGYKFRLYVYPNSDGIGSGTHLSVYAQRMRGEYDNELEWPFEGDIRVELLNWRADKNHHSRYNWLQQIQWSWWHVLFSCHWPRDCKWFWQYLNSYLTLDLASTTNTEYLRDDYLKLRVSAIVYSTPLLPLTPAWQDSLSTTQSGAQFHYNRVFQTQAVQQPILQSTIHHQPTGL